MPYKQLPQDVLSDGEDVNVPLPTSRHAYTPKLQPHRYYHRHEPLREESSSGFVYSLKIHIYMLWSFLIILFRPLNILIVVLSLLSTWICHKYKFYTDVPLYFFGQGIIFPISFILNYTYQRRERVLHSIASIKATAITIYSNYREWTGEHQNGTRLPPEEREYRVNLTREVKEILTFLFADMNKFLSHRGSANDLARIYRSFDLLSKAHEDLRRSEDWIKGVISRMYYNHRLMLNDFENLKIIHTYRTTSALRAFGWLFLTFYPLFFGPMFANYSNDYGLWAGMYVSVLSSLMFGYLYQLLADLEDPFDVNGIDDLNLGVLEEIPSHMTEYSP
eukprot:TRINITY_DN5862_c0_g4_i1.p1 TRINITY_DN5862_c0_g4~~TRINITY_DN5862_c0_g4_i1.p1  ORF type:complete len:334 (-),score=46.11 TRINITY_DN5862_c0_g4_i1:91-1092(-)